jgi:hypothetical protein
MWPVGVQTTVLIAALGGMWLAINKRFDSVDKRFESVDKRIDKLDEKFTNEIHKLDEKFTNQIHKLDEKFTNQIHELDEKFTNRLDKVDEKLINLDKRFFGIETILIPKLLQKLGIQQGGALNLTPGLPVPKQLNLSKLSDAGRR